MALVDFKPKLTSVTIWAGIVGVLAFGGKQFLQVDIDPATQAQIVNETTALASKVFDIIAGVSSLVAIWGRVRATKRV